MIFPIRNVVLRSIGFVVLCLLFSSSYAGLFDSRYPQSEVGASGVVYTDKKGESLPVWVKARWQDDKRVEVAVFPNIQQSLKNPAYTELQRLAQLRGMGSDPQWSDPDHLAASTILELTLFYYEERVN